MYSAVRAILLAAFALCLFPLGTAHAKFSFPPQYGSWWGDHAPFRHNHQHRHTKSESAKANQPQDTPKGPLQIIISIADQRVSLYDNGSLIARSSVSTGVPRHPTPLGVFSVIGKERWHRSNLYSGAPMPYMQRITQSGIALHAGVLPGYPASHGCIRLTNDFAIRLWHLTKRGPASSSHVRTLCLLRYPIHTSSSRSRRLRSIRLKICLSLSQVTAIKQPRQRRRLYPMSTCKKLPGPKRWARLPLDSHRRKSVQYPFS